MTGRSREQDAATHALLESTRRLRQNVVERVDGFEDTLVRLRRDLEACRRDNQALRKERARLSREAIRLDVVHAEARLLPHDHGPLPAPHRGPMRRPSRAPLEPRLAALTRALEDSEGVRASLERERDDLAAQVRELSAIISLLLEGPAVHARNARMEEKNVREE